MNFRNCFVGITLLLSLPVSAAPNAIVEGVQMPAWIERDGARAPLVVGMEVRNGDQVRTGSDARMLVRTADGSHVKLGENAVLRFDNLHQKRVDQNPLFTAALDVLKGAFRFTTRAVKKLGGGREQTRNVSVRIATVTAGIRGTDLWGKAAPDKDIVCLIEGKIAVTRENDEPVMLQDPLSFYIAPKNAKPLPVGPVDPKQLETWAAETEIATGQGAARMGGKWKVNALQAETQAEALAAYDQLRDAGYAAEIRPVTLDGKQLYHVRIANLPNKAEALALAGKVKGVTGGEPTVSM